MKSKNWIVILVISLLFVSFKMYSWNTDKKLMKKTDKELKFLLKPYINNTVIIANQNKYYLRIKKVKLSDKLEPYKKALNIPAYVYFDVYKNKVNKDNYIDSRLIRMEVWREELDNDFRFYKNGGETNISFKGEIFKEFTNMYFDLQYENRNKTINEGVIKNCNTGYSHGKFDEDNNEYNKYGEITSKGNVRYEIIKYRRDLSMKFTTSFYLNNFKEYQKMHIKVKRTEGNYHALWDISNEEIKTIKYHYRGKYKEGKVITNDFAIEELITYLKGIPFKEAKNEIIKCEPLIFIKLGKYGKDIILCKDAIYTNNYHVVCKGENYVEKIISLLKKNN